MSYACGWGTFTMEPLMLPMKTMLPGALRAIWLSGRLAAQLTTSGMMKGSVMEVDSHQVPCHGRGKQIGAVDIDAPELPHAVDRVGDGFKVLGEARRRDQVVDPAVLGDDLGNASLDTGLVGDVGVVSCYSG